MATAQVLACYWLIVAAFWAFIYAQGYALPQAAHLRAALSMPWTAEQPVGRYLLTFAALAIALIVTWLLSIRAIARQRAGPGLVLSGTVVLALPLVLLPAIYSDDVYLYHFYGRELSHYGANPLTTPPSVFDGDPHLERVYWKWLPSSYGSVWLGLSAALSGVAGDSLTAAVLLYRLAGLAAHLATAVLLWVTVRHRGTGEATAAAAFFAWNPFVLFESVASAHNDALVTAFVCLAVLAWTRGFWAGAAVALAAATMVKPYAVVLLVPLGAAVWVGGTRQRRGARLALLGVAFGATVLVLYAPLWAGGALVRNIVENPASGAYANTLWELAAAAIGTGAAGALRLVLLMGVLAASARVAAAHGFAAAALVAWTGFCFCLSWLWPWYFTPALALAPLAGRSAWPLAVAISAGGLLFYLAWPPPPAPYDWLHTWRAVLLFGPPLAVLGWYVRGARRVTATPERFPSARR